MQQVDILKKCQDKGLRMTEQRKVIASVISSSDDHPDVEEIYRRSHTQDQRIGIATVYRTVKMLEESEIIERHDFGDGKARYEQASDEHHDHLIDVRTGKIIEFQNEEIERIQEEVAKKLGYKLIDHRLELYAIPLDDAKSE